MGYCKIFWNIIQILCNLIEYCAILWIMQNIVDNVKYCGYVTAGVCKLPPPMIKAMSWQHPPPPTPHPATTRVNISHSLTPKPRYQDDHTTMSWHHHPPPPPNQGKYKSQPYPANSPTSKPNDQTTKVLSWQRQLHHTRVNISHGNSQMIKRKSKCWHDHLHHHHWW